MAPRGDDGGDRKHKPSRRRLHQARRRGQVPKSREVGLAATLAGLLAVGWAGGPVAFGWARVLMDTALEAAAHPTPEAVAHIMRSSAVVGSLVVMGVLTPVLLFGIAAHFAYVGPVLSSSPLRPDFGRLNPTRGLSQFFSAERGWEFTKMTIKVTLLTPIVVLEIIKDLQTTDYATDGGSILSEVFQSALTIFMGAVVIQFGVAIGDAIIQKIMHQRRLRMTSDERKRERKEMEGNPQIKRQRRKLHREWANSDPLQAVRKANVLVLNPTHLAIALAYDPAEHAVPVVSAKAEDYLALAMRDEAEAAGVPTVQNVSLARALYRRIDVDEPVPADLFTVVAEVIIWARRIRDTQTQGEQTDAQ